MDEDRAFWLLLRYGGFLSLGAAAIHAAVIESHLEEWWGYGLFFILASIAQGVYGLVLLALPLHPDWDPRQWARFKHRLLWVGILGNLAVIALYTVTRTTGIPVLVPGAAQVEPVAALDLVSKGVEAALVACLVLMLWVDRSWGAASQSPASTRRDELSLFAQRLRQGFLEPQAVEQEEQEAP
jgi:hypothetical protein